MADTDLLRPRGVPYAAVVDATGVASGGTSTAAQLAAKGIRVICQVDATGLASSDGTSTVAVLASRGLLAFAAVDENGVSTDDAVSTADVIRRRGIRPMVPVNANGIAATGSATMLTLAQRGLDYFCPVDESGAAVDLTPVPPNTIRARAGMFVFTGESMTPIAGYVVTAQAGAFALTDPGTTKLTPPVPSYTGPGNIAGYTTASAYWGLRAFTAANAAALVNLIDITDGVGANPLTVKCTSTGNLDVAAINAWVTANSVLIIRVAKIYDQSGNGLDMNVIQTNIQKPTLIMSGVGFGSIPVVRFTNTNSTDISTSATTPTINTPFTVSTVCRNPTFAAGAIMFSNGTAFQLAALAAAQDGLYAGSAYGGASAVADLSWGATQFVNTGSGSSTINSSNSSFNTSAAPATVSTNPGSNNISSGNGQLSMGSRAGSIFYDGHIFEMMIIPGAVSSANQALMAANQRAYGGF